MYKGKSIYISAGESIDLTQGIDELEFRVEDSNFMIMTYLDDKQVNLLITELNRYLKYKDKE